MLRLWSKRLSSENLVDCTRPASLLLQRSELGKRSCCCRVRTIDLYLYPWGYRTFLDLDVFLFWMRSHDLSRLFDSRVRTLRHGGARDTTRAPHCADTDGPRWFRNGTSIAPDTHGWLSLSPWCLGLLVKGEINKDREDICNSRDRKWQSGQLFID